MVLDDPFHDISVGGDQIPGQTQGFLSVWATTLTGRVSLSTPVKGFYLYGLQH